MTSKVSPLPPPSIAWIDTSTGKPTQAFLQFMLLLARGNLGPFPSATDDASAAKNGVAIGSLYQSNGIVRVRLS